METKKALLIGINSYDYLEDLPSSEEDVKLLQPLVANNLDGEGDEYRNFECDPKTIGKFEFTRSELEQCFQEFLQRPADYGLIYYSGHGVINNELGGFIAASDSASYNLGIPFSTLMQYVQHSPIKKLVIILDCCYAGSVANIGNTGVAIIREGVSILASSGRTEESKARGGNSVFTKVLCEALQGGAADTVGKVTIAGLYSYVDELYGAFEQRPQFKSHLSRMFTVRQVKPALPLKELKKMPQFFSTEDAEFPIDKTYEKTEPIAIEANVAKLETLQKYRAVHLVVPKHEEHTYWELLREEQDGAMLLTSKGKFYWQLVRRNALPR